MTEVDNAFSAAGSTQSSARVTCRARRSNCSAPRGCVPISRGPGCSTANGRAAAGETARKRTVTTSRRLTTREAQIVRMARAGLSNPEIGTRLFLSPRTVEYHLGNVFGKLGITSRDELDRVIHAIE